MTWEPKSVPSWQPNCRSALLPLVILYGRRLYFPILLPPTQLPCAQILPGQRYTAGPLHISAQVAVTQSGGPETAPKTISRRRSFPWIPAPGASDGSHLCDTIGSWGRANGKLATSLQEGLRERSVEVTMSPHTHTPGRLPAVRGDPRDQLLPMG